MAAAGLIGRDAMRASSWRTLRPGRRSGVGSPRARRRAGRHRQDGADRRRPAPARRWPPVRAAAPAAGSQAWGPVVAALRAAAAPARVDRRARTAARRTSPCCCPRLGARPPDASDRGDGRRGRARRVRVAGARRRRRRSSLDDLQWADHATCELLPVLAAGERRAAAARGRGLPLRGAAPPASAAGGAARAAAWRARCASWSCSRSTPRGHARARRAACSASRRTTPSPPACTRAPAACRSPCSSWRRPSRAAADADAPLPETLREAVLTGLAGVPAEARAALEQAAALGVRFDLRLAAELAGEAAVLAALEAGPLEEAAPGEAAFRHALVREAVLADVPWPRRRVLHERAATALAASGAPAVAVAEQWLAARRTDGRRRPSPPRRASRSPMYAARDALALAPRGLCQAGELDAALERGRCWRSPAARRSRAASCRRRRTRWSRGWRERPPTAASAHRALQHLAGVLELRGEWQRALDARLVAADELVRGGRPGAAARERLRVVSVRQSGRRAGADAAARRAGPRRGRAGRRRATRSPAPWASRGRSAASSATTSAGSRWCGRRSRSRWSTTTTPRRAETYTKLAVVLAHARGLRRRRATRTGRRTRCARRAGWPARATSASRASATCCARAATGSGRSRSAPRCRPTRRRTRSSRAEINIAAVRILRGETRQGRPLAERFVALCRDADLPVGEVEGPLDRSPLADEADGRRGRRGAVPRAARPARRHRRPPLRRAGAALDGDVHGGPRRCGRRAPVRRGAVGAHLGGRASRRRSARSPTCSARSRCWRATRRRPPTRFEAGAGRARPPGGAVGPRADRAAGRRRARGGGRPGARAGPHRRGARGARRSLGARPLAARAAAELRAVEGGSAARTAPAPATHGLTRRELQILRRVAAGRTNRQIAEELVLSPRTIEMHAQNAFAQARRPLARRGQRPRGRARPAGAGRDPVAPVP